MIQENINNINPTTLFAKQCALMHLNYNGIISVYFSPETAIIGRDVPISTYIDTNPFSVPVARSLAISYADVYTTDTVCIAFTLDNADFPDPNIFISRIDDTFSQFATSISATYNFDPTCGFTYDGFRVPMIHGDWKYPSDKLTMQLVIHLSIDETRRSQILDLTGLNPCLYLEKGLSDLGYSVDKNTVRNFLSAKILEVIPEINDGVTTEDMVVYDDLTAQYQTLLESSDWINTGQLSS